jgi:hypothetical protein
MKTAISSDPHLEATIAVQAAVIDELRAANAEQARLIATIRTRVAELERRLGPGLLELVQAAVFGCLRKPGRTERHAAERAVHRRPGKQPGAPGRSRVGQLSPLNHLNEHHRPRFDGHTDLPQPAATYRSWPSRSVASCANQVTSPPIGGARWVLIDDLAIDPRLWPWVRAGA